MAGDKQTFEQATISVNGIGTVIDYDLFDPEVLKGLDEIDIASLQGRARGDYYAKRLIRYLRGVEKLPADADGAIFMKGISEASGVPYQNLFGAGKLSPMIELARQRKGLERWSELVARKGRDSQPADNSKDRQRAKALEERLRVALEELDAEKTGRELDKAAYEKRIRALEEKYDAAQFFDEFLLSNNGRVLE